MKLTKYLVTFRTGIQIFVFASNYETARILAQAEQIKAVNDYRVIISIDEVD